MAKTDTYNHEPLWPRLLEAVENRGTLGMLTVILGAQDPYERVSLYRFMIRGLMFRDWRGKNLDSIIELAEKAIEDTLVSARNGVSDQDWFKDQANIMSYNMAANLADCWGDGIPRETRHFQQGLKFAEQAIRFRGDLKKGPGPFFMAYWGKGIHQLFLGQLQEGLKSLEQSFKHSVELAKAQGKPTQAEKNAPFEVILATGYLAIARSMNGQADASCELDQALDAFNEMKGISAEAKEDAQIGIDQLNAVRRKFGL